MAVRSRLLAGSAVPIVVATAIILVWSLAFAGRDLTSGSTLRMIMLGSIGGTAALLLAGFMYRYATTLANRIDHLIELASATGDSDKPAPSDTTKKGDEFDVVSDALLSIRDVSQRQSELSRSYEALQAESLRTQKVADELRKNEIRVADCLERLRRAEQSMMQRTRSAALGRLFAGACREFNEQLEFIVTPGESTPASIRLIAAAKELKHRMGLYAQLSGRRERSVTSFKLRELLDDTVLATEPRWKDEALSNGSSLRIAVACADDITVTMDRGDLLEMLVYILDNAVDAMPMGGSITLEAQKGSQGTVMLTVHDQGEGMGEEAVRVCCEPFFTTREGSAGMGLAVVSAMARSNGVRFGVRSTRGQGTTAVLELPTARAAARPEAKKQTATPPPMMVLAVDDNGPTMELITEMLQLDGHIVDACTDPRQVMERLEIRKYDVLLCDRAMPHMNGFELARMVKSKHAGLPIIMLTGFAELMKVRGEETPHVDLLLEKPFMRADLQNALAKVGRGSKATAHG